MKKKAYSPNDVNRNLYIAGHGNLDGTAVALYDLMTSWLELTPEEGKYVEHPVISGDPQERAREYAFDIALRFHNALINAMKTKNGKVFKDLAKACERGPGSKADPFRRWMMAVFFPLYQPRPEQLSIAEVIAKAEQFGKNTGAPILPKKRSAQEKLVERAARELGIDLKPLRKRKSD